MLLGAAPLATLPLAVAPFSGGGSGSTCTLDGGLALEWLAADRADVALPGELSLSLCGDGSLPAEWPSGVRQDGSAATEWLATARREAGLPVANLAAAAGDAALPDEWRGALALALDGLLPLEWLGLVRADGMLPVEFAGAAGFLGRIFLQNESLAPPGVAAEALRVPTAAGEALIQPATASERLQ
ncbi:MAG TPA: hypothetical protein VMU42_02650 [Candidatus Sulfotelmatobacter sp.]|nr:hypothetical protein [Candidatus Sulfotelmatobacter sp.]